MKESFRLAACAAVLTAFAFQSDAADMLTFAMRGKASDCAIVVPASPSKAEQHAADELSAYIEKSTGARLAVIREDGAVPKRAIFVGDAQWTRSAVTNAASMSPDSFVLKAVPPRFAIVGGGRRGTLYGVYDFLERHLDIAWLASWCEDVPKRDALQVPADEFVVESPAFELREDYWFDYFNPDIALRNKTNGELVRFREEHGGAPEHRFGGGLGNAHTFDTLVPRGEFFAEHPEYYSMDENGSRGTARDRSWQLCLTNPDVLEIAKRRVLERIERDPGAECYGVSQMDNMNYCRCPACTAVNEEEGAPSGTLVRFVNAIAEAVEKKFPGKKVSTLAYQYSRRPPKKTRIRGNVVPVICTSGCGFSKSLDVLAESGDEGAAAFLADLEAWGKATDQLYIWNYSTDFRNYLMPFPNAYTLRENLRLFRRMGVTRVFEEGAYMGRHGEFAELKGYLTAKWLWNPDLPAEPLIDRFMRGYYGAAAPYVREYFDMLHSLDIPHLAISADTDVYWLTDDFLARATRIWSKAQSAVRDDPARLYNVRMGAMSVVFVRTLRMMNRTRKSHIIAKDVSRLDIARQIAPSVKWMKARLAEAKDMCLSEYRGNETFLADFDRALAAEPPKPGNGSRMFTADEVRFSEKPEHGSRVADPDSMSGDVIRLNPTHVAWCVTLDFAKIAFDAVPGVVVRFRAKAERKRGWEGHAGEQAFTAGVYDEGVKRNWGIVKRVGELDSDGWQWYEIAVDREPNDKMYFWFAPGDWKGREKGGEHPAVSSVWFDALEIRQAPPLHRK